MRILHPEDNSHDSELLGAELARQGVDCELERVQTGDDFVSNLERGNIDLIRSDYIGPQVVIRMADSGHGVTPEITDNIFEPFFTTRDLSQGSELGLSTVLGIVKGHGGFLNLFSQPEKDATSESFLDETLQSKVPFCDKLLVLVQETVHGSGSAQ